ncbi:ArsR/SmtB family transcription factor [Nitrospira sp. Kam-Ns4a]
MRQPSLTTPQCAAVLRALGDETRLRILESLLLQDKCVSDLVREMRRGQPHVSHHLRILREAGLIEGLRAGRRVCYRVAPRLRRVFRDRDERGLDFGCCQIRFPEDRLADRVGRRAPRQARTRRRTEGQWD